MTVMNPEFVANIRKSPTRLVMKTNAGTRVIDKIADVPMFGTAWFDEQMVANILGFASLKDKYPISYSIDNDAFYVQLTPNKYIVFERTPEGLYVYKPTKSYFDEVKRMKTGEQNMNIAATFIQSVEDNMKKFTEREVKDAEKALRLYVGTGFHTPEDFKQFLRQGLLLNNPVVPKDVKVLEAIYGPNVDSLKGKSTRPKSPRV